MESSNVPKLTSAAFASNITTSFTKFISYGLSSFGFESAINIISKTLSSCERIDASNPFTSFNSPVFSSNVIPSGNVNSAPSISATNLYSSLGHAVPPVQVIVALLMISFFASGISII